MYKLPNLCNQWYVYCILIGGTIVLIILLNRKNPVFAGKTIDQSFQKLLNDLRQKNLIASSFWSTKQISQAKIWLIIDGIFALFYTGLLSLVCGCLGQSSTDIFGVIGKSLSYIVLLGAVIDIGENIVLWLILNGKSSKNFLHFATYLGLLKWLMPALGIFYLVFWLINYIGLR